MSRCFPFPPPGYEKKARNDDDADLLAKVMHKEKKHKKKKKDKDKIEGKEKDKERNKDKHREKKDRKEKHKDKKDKGRNKDKNKISDQTRNGGTDGCNGELRERSHQAEGLKDSKLVEELGRRIRDEATGNGNQVAANLIVDDQRRNEGFGRTTERQMDKRAEGKDKNKEKQGDDRGSAKQRDEWSGISNEMVRNIIITDQGRIEGNKSAEKEAEKRIEGKEKNAKGKDGDYGRGEKQKDREHEEKRTKRKDKVRDKEKKNEKVKVKEHGNHKHNKETDKLKEGGRTEQMDDALILKHLYPLKDSENIVTTGENLKKRKESKTNGCIHESDLRPNKLLRPAYSSNPHSENGRKLESCSIAIPCALDRQGASDSKKGKINKVYKANGTVEVQPSSVVPIPSLSAEARENGEAAVTLPPHPDSKYLNQILSVPKLEERSDIDDQEWLFSSNQLKLKPKAVACDASKTRVWAEAQHIDSADVFALPYVIPY